MIKRKKLETMADLIAAAGSATKLAASIDCAAHTIDNWTRIGIPTKYWDKLAEIYGASPEELYIITKHARENCKK